MTTTGQTAETDEQLQAMLDRSAHDHARLAEVDRKDRRAVWLRLHEDHRYTYDRLATVTGYGVTTVFKEVKRAREERDVQADT